MQDCEQITQQLIAYEQMSQIAMESLGPLGWAEYWAWSEDEQVIA
jgi:hypothetical protein